MKEELAKYAHITWTGWMKYLFEKSTFNDNGTVTIPKGAVERWRNQCNTQYADLSEKEKDSDRDEADAILNIIKTNRKEVMEAYKERMLKEKEELNRKINLLTIFIKNPETFKRLEIVEQSLLEDQLTVMQKYSSILGERINLFKEKPTEK